MGTEVFRQSDVMPNAKMKFVLTIFSMTFSILTKGQNLISNYSFEEYESCPTAVSQLNRLTAWFNPTAHSPDCHNACETTGEAGVPQNFFGNQNARTGVGYTGIGVALYSGSREYIEVKLLDSLVAGEDYCVQFYVSLADSCLYASDDIGAYFSPDSVFSSNVNPLLSTPQIENDSGVFLTNKTDWTLVSGQFTATGGERYLVIGNFKNEANTDTVSVPGGGTFSPGNYTGAYYYIDDVSVTSCDSVTGLQENLALGNFSIYPNPTSQYATLEFNNYKNENHTLTLYDAQGGVVRTMTNIASDKVEIEIRNLPSGLYFFQLSTDRQVRAIGKLIVE